MKTFMTIIVVHYCLLSIIIIFPIAIRAISSPFISIHYLLLTTTRSEANITESEFVSTAPEIEIEPIIVTVPLIRHTSVKLINDSAAKKVNNSQNIRKPPQKRYATSIWSKNPDSICVKVILINRKKGSLTKISALVKRDSNTTIGALIRSFIHSLFDPTVGGKIKLQRSSKKKSKKNR